MRQMRNKQVQQPLRYDGAAVGPVGRSRDIPRCGENYGRYAEIVIYTRERRGLPRTDADGPAKRRRRGAARAAVAAPQPGLEIAGNVCKGPLAPHRSFSCARLHGISISASHATRKTSRQSTRHSVEVGFVSSTGAGNITSHGLREIG